MAGRKREPAIRLFAQEYNNASLDIKGEEEYSPSYLITPLGAKVNRVYFIGVLTEKENIGSEAEPLFRARVKDPTGTFFLSSGSYQPEATAVLRDIQVPALVSVVGKIRTFQTDEGGYYVSVRPERVAEVSKEQRDFWIYRTSNLTKQRVDDYERAVNLPDMTRENLQADGFDEHQADGYIEAVHHYGIVDVEGYKETVKDALGFILRDTEMLMDMTPSEDMLAPDLSSEPVSAKDDEMKDIGDEMDDYGEEVDKADLIAVDEDGAELEEMDDGEETNESETSDDGEVTNGSETSDDGEEVATGSQLDSSEGDSREPAGEDTADEPSSKEESSDETSDSSDDDVGLEQKILEAIKELSTGPRGASYSEVQEKLEGMGVGSTKFDEAINLLLDKGIIYEPSVNRINVVNY